MNLPNCSEAFVPIAKLRDYLLSPSHPEGGPKSVIFEIMGYTLHNISELESALLSIAHEGEVVSSNELPFGNKYIVDGKLPRQQGTEILLRTVWIIDRGETAPRFITAYPL